MFSCIQPLSEQQPTGFHVVRQFGFLAACNSARRRLQEHGTAMSGDLSPCYYSLSGPQFAWFSAFLPYSHFLNSNRPACAVAFSLHVTLLVADCQRTGRPCPAIRLCYPLSGPQFSWFSAFLPSSLISQHFIGCIVQEVFGSRHLFALCFKRDSASSSHSLICLTRIVWTLLWKIEPD